MGPRLKVVDDTPASSIARDGARNFVQPADVSGRYTRIRRVVFAVLIAVYLLTPFIRFGGKPLVFLDVAHRRFHLFGSSFNSNDFWLVFFLVTGVGFGLIFVTTLFGRVWCGYACPQTVFLEGVYRRVERLVEGNRNERVRRNQGPWTAEKLTRKLVKHSIFVAISVGLAHVFLAYFVSFPSMWTMVTSRPAEHVQAFVWTSAFSIATFFNFGWFREQVCLIICPYGRLQSVMTDRNTFNVAYDVARGEPRGKPSDAGVGDCVDCMRCVQVCPTGIDIRNGLQLDCVGCASCIDACDDVMVKLERPRGLIRYDSPNGLEGRGTRLLRPRVWVYAAFGLVGLVAAAVAMAKRVPFEAHLLRTAGAVFVTTDDEVKNPVRFHVVNKRDDPMVLSVRDESDEAVRSVPAVEEIALAPGQSRYVAFVLAVDRAAMRPGLRAKFVLAEGGERVEVGLPVLGPMGRGND
jgi:cytochrome c oxidase accessory protein FixG